LQGCRRLISLLDDPLFDWIYKRVEKSVCEADAVRLVGVKFRGDTGELLVMYINVVNIWLTVSPFFLVE